MLELINSDVITNHDYQVVDKHKLVVQVLSQIASHRFVQYMWPVQETAVCNNTANA